MKNIPPAVITLWMPTMLLVGLCLFLNGQPWQYWAICVLILPLLAHMNTLADVHSSNGKVRIRRWWGTFYVNDNDILEIAPSMLEGIWRMRLRRFVLPWGIVYFVADWSSLGLPQRSARASSLNGRAESTDRLSNLLASILLSVSGIVLGRVIRGDMPALSNAVSSARTISLLAAGTLAMAFAFTRRRMPTFSNMLLFSSTLIMGFIWGGMT